MWVELPMLMLIHHVVLYLEETKKKAEAEQSDRKTEAVTDQLRN